MRSVKTKANLCVSTWYRHSLVFAHTMYETWRRVRPKPGHLAWLDDRICTLKIWLFGGLKVPWIYDTVQMLFGYRFLIVWLKDADINRRVRIFQFVVLPSNGSNKVLLRQEMWIPYLLHSRATKAQARLCQKRSLTWAFAAHIHKYESRWRLIPNFGPVSPPERHAFTSWNSVLRAYGTYQYVIGWLIIYTLVESCGNGIFI